MLLPFQNKLGKSCLLIVLAAAEHNAKLQLEQPMGGENGEGANHKREMDERRGDAPVTQQHLSKADPARFSMVRNLGG